ncbi:MAG TPA: hypothetical protein VGD81_04880 [Opitutaceae bacterium]
MARVSQRSFGTLLVLFIGSFTTLNDAAGFGSTPPPPEPGTTAESVLALSPFTVSSARDQGFVAGDALASGRLATPLARIPVAYSVLTREFIDALNLADVESAMNWAVGAYTPTTSTLNYKFFNFEGGSSVISRGIQTNAPQRNFFLLGQNSDTYSQERIEFARGPNAPLTGTSGLGGIVNSVTKQAQPGVSFTRMGLTFGSWERVRTTLDVNRSAGETFAVRVNALAQDAEGWRDMIFDEREGVHAALTYAPFKTTRVRFEYEHYRQDMLFGLESILDRVSGWDGTTVAAAPGTAIADSDAKGVARVGSSTAPYLVYVPGSDANRVLNWANTWTTLGGAATPAVPVGGLRPASTAGLGIDGGAIIGSVYPADQLFGLAEAGSSFRRPDRGTILSPDAPNVRYGFENTALFLEQQVGRHLFLEGAANYADTKHSTEYLQTNGLAEVRIDVNETLPDGTPNPNFLQAYGEGVNGHTHFDDRIVEGRFGAALVFEDTRWGDFRGNLIVGGRRAKSFTRESTEVLVRDPDPRRRPTRDAFRYRYYWNDPVRPFTIPGQLSAVDPVAGTVQTYDVETVVDLANPGNQRIAKTKFAYLQGAVEGRWFDDRLTLLAGARRDAYRTESFTLHGSPAAVASDFPVGWDGQTIVYRPSAPDDYWTLTYVPKAADGTPLGPPEPALTRPRANGVALPQYAGDRFRDDYSAPEVRFAITTVTYGGVWRITPWLSAVANYAESFNPPVSGLTLTGASVPPSRSEGWDAGLRLTLLGGRVRANVGRYESTQQRTSFDSTGSTRKYATIASANAVGDLSSSGINQRDLALVPVPTFDFRDREAEGWEIDVVANLMPAWRLMANASWPDVSTVRPAQDEWAYLDANEATLRQIVLDAGAAIDAAGTATVDTNVPVARRSPDVSAAVAAWNDIQTFKAANTPHAVTPTNLPDRTANLYTDHRLGREGLLAAFRIGAGVQYIGRRIIGNRGADTIVDPANPARAVDDPSVDARTPVYRTSYYTVLAGLAFQHRLRHGALLSANLTVSNLLDEERLIYIGTGLRPLGGDLARPDRVTVPTSFVYLQPRSWTLSVSLEF